MQMIEHEHIGPRILQKFHLIVNLKNNWKLWSIQKCNGIRSFDVDWLILSHVWNDDDTHCRRQVIDQMEIDLHSNEFSSVINEWNKCRRQQIMNKTDLFFRKKRIQKEIKKSNKKKKKIAR